MSNDPFPKTGSGQKDEENWKGKKEAFSTGRGIEGFSQGGRGTVRYMFAHPELFCSAAPGGSGLGAERAQANDNGVETSSFEPPVVRRTPIIFKFNLSVPLCMSRALANDRFHVKTQPDPNCRGVASTGKHDF